MTVRSGVVARTLVVAACGCIALAAGCARSIIADGRIRPEAFESIVTRTEQARGIDLEGEVDARVVSREELAATVEEAATGSWSEQEYRDYEASLVAMGLWPPGRDLFGDYVAALSGEAVGLYIPEQRALYIVDDVEVPARVAIASALTRRDLMREAVLTHEIVHALQHQAYPELIELATTLRAQDDVVSALQAAIEGDAMRYGFAALDARIRPPAPVDLEEQVRAETDSGALGDAPLLIRDAVVFPYVEGYRLSMLEASLLLDRPPASTEQVLHHAKRSEAFLVIDLRALHGGLAPGCRVLQENTLGEFGLSILFRELAVSPSPRAWQGWDGDRFLVARCAERLELLWLSAWDSNDDAAEFATAYQAVAASIGERAELDGAPEVHRDGRRVIVFTPAFADAARSASQLARETRAATLVEVVEAFGLEAGARDRASSGAPVREASSGQAGNVR